MSFNSSDTQSSPLTVSKAAQKAHHLNNILSSKCCTTCSDLDHPVAFHNYSCQKFNNQHIVKFGLRTDSQQNLDGEHLSLYSLLGQNVLYFVLLRKKTWQCKLLKSSVNENPIKAVFLFRLLLRSTKFCSQFSVKKCHLN